MYEYVFVQYTEHFCNKSVQYAEHFCGRPIFFLKNFALHLWALIYVCPQCPLCPLTAFFFVCSNRVFAIFTACCKKIGSFAFFPCRIFAEKSLKKVMKVFENRNVNVVYLHPHSREAARQSARITAVSLLHHCCIAADTL